jgi:hypothetical protein
MMLRRSARRLAATMAVALMLYAQFAIAAHACDVIAGASATHEAMPMGDDCHPAPPAQDKTCLDHCAGAQSVDNHGGSVPAPVLVPVFTLAPNQAPAASLYSTESYTHALLARVTAPPLPVRHCCFRT